MPQDSQRAHLVPTLSVPSPWAARHPATITKIKELRSWTENLPLADPLRCAELLLQQLQMLVYDPSPQTPLSELLACYHQPLTTLHQRASKGASTGRKNKTQVLLQQHLAELLEELAIGHMRSVNRSILAENAPQASDVYHAMLALTHLVQSSILQYHLPSPRLWQQILRLYVSGDCYALLALPVRSELALTHTAEDIRSNFNATLLLLLCDPYRLPSTSLERLVASLPAIAGLAHTSEEASGNFSVPISLAGELPPMHLARQPSAVKTLSYLVLDDFLAQLDLHGLTQDPDASIAPWLSETLKALGKQSDRGEARRHKRRPRLMDYQVHVGVMAICERLRELQGARQETDEFEETIDIGAPLINPLVPRELDCQQLDQSRSGAAFRLEHDEKCPAIGEVLLFESQSKDDSAVGFVGQLCRQLQRDNGQIDIGVEKLRGNLAPVRFGQARGQHQALLHADRDHARLQLICEPGACTFIKHAEHTLRGVNKEYRVRLLAELEARQVHRMHVELLEA